MGRSLKLAGLVCLFVTLWGMLPLAAAEAPSEKAFLLRLYYHWETEQGYDQRETLVFRDGLSVSILKGRFRGNNFEVLTRSEPLPEDFHELTRALADFRIGQVAGSCTSRVVVRSEESYSWFGKGRRQNTFVVGTRFDVPCPEETERLLSAIQKFFPNRGGGSTEMVELHD